MTDVLDNLAGLDAAQLKEAQARINFLLTAGKGEGKAVSTKAQVTDDDVLAFDAFRDALASVGAYCPKSLATFRRHPFLVTKYDEGMEVVRDYIDTQLAPGRKVERGKAWRFLLRLLVRNRRARRREGRKVREVDAQSLIYDLPNVSRVVEEAFPGYLDAGMLHVLISPKTLPRPRVRVAEVG